MSLATQAHCSTGPQSQTREVMSERTVEEQRWALAIENATFGVWDLDPRIDSVHYSPRWKARLGFPRIDAPDDTAFWRCRVHPDDFESMVKSLRSHLDGSSPTYAVRFRLRCNGWGYRTVLSRGRVVTRDAAGNATRMIGTMVDLTGWTAPVATHGLAAEEQRPADVVSRLPFHMALHAAPLLQDGGAPEGHRLVELVADLLDIAMRDAGAPNHRERPADREA